MKKQNEPDDTFSALDDYYLAQSSAFVEIFLVDQGLTHQMLLLLPKEKSCQILKLALDFAAEQITRREAMIRLGQKDTDTKFDRRPRQHLDRLSHRFNRSTR